MANVSAGVKKNIDKRKLTALIIALSVLVIAGVFWWLRLIGITKTATPTCGKEEHIHTEACMKKTLICELDEVTDEAEVTEENETTDADGENETEVDVERVTHIHNDSCYSVVYDCDGNGNEIEEHEHSLSCYSDINADLETAEDWENSLP